MQKGQVHGKCVGGAQEMVGISAERSSTREVLGRCVGGGGDKCRKVKCTGGAREVVGISAERSSVWEVVGISAERSSVLEVCRRSYTHYKR